MHQTLQKFKDKRANGDDGFTLIELLVVVVIIGVLVAIAIPVYLSYTKGAQNKSAQSDVRSAISTVENYYITNSNQLPSTTGTTLTSGSGTPLDFPAKTGGTAQKAAVSDGNVLAFKNNDPTYVLCAQNTDGKEVYVYNSLNGGSVKKSTAATVTACIAAGS